MVVAKKAIPLLTEHSFVSIEWVNGILDASPANGFRNKYRGQPLYKLARQGLEIERAPREIEIFSNELIDFEAVRVGWIFVFDVQREPMFEA